MLPFAEEVLSVLIECIIFQAFLCLGFFEFAGLISKLIVDTFGFGGLHVTKNGLTHFQTASLHLVLNLGKGNM